MLDEKYENADDIPESYAHLYTEADGVFTLMAGTKLKTADEVNKLVEGNRKERAAHDETKKTLKVYQGLGEVDEIQGKFDRIGELEAAAGDKIDETKLNELVEARVKRDKAPLQRELDEAKETLANQSEQVTTLQKAADTRMIHDHIRKHAGDSLQVGGMNDALTLSEHHFHVREDGDTRAVVTKENIPGVTAGVTGDIWLTEMRENNGRDNWFNESRGGGSRGSSGDRITENPYSNKHWNETKQAELISKSPERAETLARSAGTTIYGERPAAE